MVNTMSLDAVVALIGSAFIGTFIVGIYNKYIVNGKNGTAVKLALLEQRITNLEREVKEVKDLILKICIAKGGEGND